MTLSSIQYLEFGQGIHRYKHVCTIFLPKRHKTISSNSSGTFQQRRSQQGLGAVATLRTHVPQSYFDSKNKLLENALQRHLYVGVVQGENKQKNINSNGLQNGTSGDLGGVFGQKVFGTLRANSQWHSAQTVFPQFSAPALAQIMSPPLSMKFISSAPGGWT